MSSLDMRAVNFFVLLTFLAVLSGCSTPEKSASKYAEKIGGKVTRFSDTKSMLPLIDKNSIGVVIEVNENTEYKIGDIVVFRESNGRFICHRVIDIKGDLLLIKGDNTISEDGWLNKDLMWYKLVKLY